MFAADEINNIVDLYVKTNNSLIKDKMRELLKIGARMLFNDNIEDLLEYYTWTFNEQSPYYTQFLGHIGNLEEELITRKEYTYAFNLAEQARNLGYCGEVGNDGHGPVCIIRFNDEIITILDESELDDFVSSNPIVIPF